MPSLLRWVLAALATWRLAQFIVYDDGPFDLMFTIRRWCRRYEIGQDGMSVSGVGRMLECEHCVGKWTALVALFLVLRPTLWGDILLGWWALAGIQSIIEAKIGKRIRG